MTIYPSVYRDLIHMERRCNCAHVDCKKSVVVQEGYCMWADKNDTERSCYIFCSLACFLDAIVPPETVH